MLYWLEKYVDSLDSQTFAVKLKGESGVAAAAAPAGITTFCLRLSDTFIIDKNQVSTAACAKEECKLLPCPAPTTATFAGPGGPRDSLKSAWYAIAAI